MIRRPNPDPDLERCGCPRLTDDEHRAVDMAGELATLICTRVIGHGATRADDVREVEALVHGLQRLVMSQLAARTDPDRYRLLGETGAWGPAERDAGTETGTEFGPRPVLRAVQCARRGVRALLRTATRAASAADHYRRAHRSSGAGVPSAGGGTG